MVSAIGSTMNIECHDAGLALSLLSLLFCSGAELAWEKTWDMSDVPEP